MIQRFLKISYWNSQEAIFKKHFSFIYSRGRKKLRESSHLVVHSPNAHDVRMFGSGRQKAQFRLPRGWQTPWSWVILAASRSPRRMGSGERGAVKPRPTVGCRPLSYQVKCPFQEIVLEQSFCQYT